MSRFWYVVILALLGGLSAFWVVNQGYDLDHLRTVALTVAAVAQTLFVAFYLTFPWFETFLGRALFGKAVSLMLIVDFAALSRWYDFGANDQIFIILYATLAAGIVGQFFAFVKVKLEGRSSEVSGNSPTHEERRW